MPPESKHTPLPTKASGLHLAPVRAAPAHDDKAAAAPRALADAQQRVHAELAHRLLVEDLDFDAMLSEACGALGEGFGKEDVGRLVDQSARQFDALGEGEARRSGGARRGRGVGDSIVTAGGASSASSPLSFLVL